MQRTSALILSLLLTACGDSATSTSISAGIPPTTGVLAASTGTTGEGATSTNTSGDPATTGPFGPDLPCDAPGPRARVVANPGAEVTLQGVWKPVLTLSMNFCGVVEGRWAFFDALMEARTLTGAEDAVLDLRLVDLGVGDGAPIATRAGGGPSATSGFRLDPVADYTRTVGWAVKYAPVVDGPLVVQLQAKGAKGVQVRDVRLLAHLE